MSRPMLWLFFGLSLAMLAVALFLLIRVRLTVRDWRQTLRLAAHGQDVRLFCRGKGKLALLCLELNAVLDGYRERVKTLTQSEEAAKQLMTSLSHDVRTPLAGLLGYLEAIERGLPSEDEKQEYLRVSLDKARDLKSFVDSTFDWFRLNSREYVFNFLPTDICELSRKVLADWLPELEARKIALTADIPEREIELTLDRRSYQRILDNIIQNAIQHGKCARLDFRLTLAPPEGGRVEIVLANDGEPIPAASLELIFQRMYKADASRGRPGSGLGLAIARELAVAHGGRISAALDQGLTVFKLTLPLNING